MCRHYCSLKDGQKGLCGVNQNIDGVVDNLVFNHPCTLKLDPIEKKPLYHFLPSTTTLSLGTVGCNFRCPFCQNWSISQENEIDTTQNVTPDFIVMQALRLGAKSISYTYNEPTIFYPYAKEIGFLAKKRGLKNVFVTNGFESPEVCDDAPLWLDGANIDLKSFKPAIYKKELNGELEGVKDTIKRFWKSGIWVEITTLIIPDVNDTDDELSEMAHFLRDEVSPDIPWHLSAFHPDYKMLDRDRTPLDTIQKACKIGKSAGLNFIYTGNVKLDLPTICPNCNEILIERDWFAVRKNIMDGSKCPKCGHKIAGVF